MFPQLVSLLIGTVLGTSVGVWILEALQPSLLKRLIGLILMGVVVIESYGASPEKLSGRLWGLCAGSLTGSPRRRHWYARSPPVILYAVAQGWSPRVMKAMLPACFFVNQSVIVANHQWASLLTRGVAGLSLCSPIRHRRHGWYPPVRPHASGPFSPSTVRLALRPWSHYVRTGAKFAAECVLAW